MNILYSKTREELNGGGTQQGFAGGCMMMTLSIQQFYFPALITIETLSYPPSTYYKYSLYIKLYYYMQRVLIV